MWSPERPASRSVHLAQQVACRSGALVILVVGTVGVLVGSHHGGRAHSQASLIAAQRQLTAQVASHASPVDAPLPSPATTTTTASTATAGSAPVTGTTVTSIATVDPASSAAPAQTEAIAKPPEPAPKGVATDTIASWYGDRPLECWEGGEPLALPQGLKMWAASRTLPCGTTIEVIGPAGTAVLLIEDHGPYLHPGRDLDLSPQAFRRVAGPLAKGVVPVQFRLAPGETPSP
ncbi:MAG TPA: septal ring lytic transglycosylase RlpA family protein [Actinomycetota bacterium]|nr:septal ring lytic transglycosylase RlpA family protein [Actinomycetota bacterium]